jgi:hypothetical protein
MIAKTSICMTRAVTESAVTLISPSHPAQSHSKLITTGD